MRDVERDPGANHVLASAVLVPRLHCCYDQLIAHLIEVSISAALRRALLWRRDHLRGLDGRLRLYGSYVVAPLRSEDLCHLLAPVGEFPAVFPHGSVAARRGCRQARAERSSLRGVLHCGSIAARRFPSRTVPSRTVSATFTRGSIPALNYPRTGCQHGRLRGA
jgi:hypothetical protein